VKRATRGQAAACGGGTRSVLPGPDSARSHTDSRPGRNGRFAFWLAVCLLAVGCQFDPLSGKHGLLGSQKLVTRPSKYSVRAEQLMILSDFKISRDHPLVQDLRRLRKQISATLDLPMQTDPVVVYLFSDELTYRQYLEVRYPDLPSRRAYFVGEPNKLAVYTYWGDKIQEDLRHEYTHGLLHAALTNVPLWLDEGLAEYFEVAGPEPGTVNVEYAHRLAEALANGWKPDIERLERLEEFSQMQRFDYQEAWAWVHFMLHSTPEAKEALVAYLRDLRTQTQPVPLSVRLQREVPEFQERLLSYVASLHSSSTWGGPL
jgi:hypothetical protein